MTTRREAAPKFRATRYTYADGGRYNRRLYTLFVNTGTEADPYYRGFGGALVTSSGKAIAFIGSATLSRVRDIENHADWFEWGNDLSGALAAIRPAAEREAALRWGA